MSNEVTVRSMQIEPKNKKDNFNYEEIGRLNDIVEGDLIDGVFSVFKSASGSPLDTIIAYKGKSNDTVELSLDWKNGSMSAFTIEGVW